MSAWQVRPMEAGGEVALEFLCQKNECGLFAVASHSKKRPHNLVLGRMFDYHLYDVLELGVRERPSFTSTPTPRITQQAKWVPQLHHTVEQRLRGSWPR
jgi:hypothetical protein